MILRYSATHKTQHNQVHRLDALDAYNQKLVKKIAVRGIPDARPRRHQRLSVPGGHRDLQRRRRWRGSRSRCSRRAARSSASQAARSSATTCTTCPANWTSIETASRSPRSTPATTRSSSPMALVLPAGEATGDAYRARHPAHPDPRDHQGAPRKGKAALRTGHQGAVAVLHRRGGEVPRLQRRPMRRASMPASSRRSTSCSRRNIWRSWRWITKSTASTWRAFDAAKTHNGYFSIDKKTKRLIDPDCQDARGGQDCQTTWTPMT